MLETPYKSQNGEIFFCYIVAGEKQIATMNTKNHDLVSTKITKSSKQKLEVIKAAHLFTDPVLANSDYAMLSQLIDLAYADAIPRLPVQA